MLGLLSNRYEVSQWIGSLWASQVDYLQPALIFFDLGVVDQKLKEDRFADRR